jgi:rhamnose transport system permease protein
MPVAIAITLVVGLLGGALNAAMITKLKAPPLIVTLGTFSLFRGIAEGLTRGIENYSGFSPSFLFLGQGYVGGVVPTQLFYFRPGHRIFLVVASSNGIRSQLLRDRIFAGRISLRGIKVRRRLNFMYCLSGLLRVWPAVIYVAHPGSGKVRRRDGLRANGDRRGGPRRCIDIRRARNRFLERYSDCLRSSYYKTVFASAGSRRNLPEF